MVVDKPKTYKALNSCWGDLLGVNNWTTLQKKTAYPTDNRGYKHVLVAGVNHLSSAITKKNHEDGTFPA
jgi:hypothetical protein